MLLNGKLILSYVARQSIARGTLLTINVIFSFNVCTCVLRLRVRSVLKHCITIWISYLYYNFILINCSGHGYFQSLFITCSSWGLVKNMKNILYRFQNFHSYCIRNDKLIIWVESSCPDLLSLLAYCSYFSLNILVLPELCFSGVIGTLALF